MSPAQRWILTDPGDKFVMKKKGKLEVSNADASDRLMTTKIQASSMDPEIIIVDDDGVQSGVDTENARDDIYQGQEMLVNTQHAVSTANFEKMRDFSEVILQPSERSKYSI